MRKGATSLKERCRYMVRRPAEVFLAVGQEPPEEATEPRDGLSQEELLKQPTYISHRPKKDPREIKVLDPACGSGHFLLYCFDLLQVIYEEAYDDPDLGPSLKKDYPTLDILRLAMPGFILKHNLHGIDIDLRATQIAALALWLRSQRAYQELGLKDGERPKITRSNIVCSGTHAGRNGPPDGIHVHPATQGAGSTRRGCLRKMKLVGEAGSLLKIEQEILEAVAAAKKEYTEAIQRRKDEAGYLPGMSPPREATLFDFADMTDEAFLTEPRRRSSEHCASTRRRPPTAMLSGENFFADDAARGFAFIDICRGRFSVVLMNPPFGLASKKAKFYVDTQFPLSKRDLYSAFVERALHFADKDGRVALISSRTGFFLNSFAQWRERIILSACTIDCYIDLGNNVLDTALVETAAYVLRNRPPIPSSRGAFLRLLDVPEDAKQTALRAMLRECPDTSRLFYTFFLLLRVFPALRLPTG